MALAKLDWRGKQVAESVMRAAHEAVDEITAAAAQDASSGAPRRYGQLASEVISEPAERQGNVIVGKFGSTKHRGFYGLILERRGRPFLRPAADRHFSNLGRRIAARIR